MQILKHQRIHHSAIQTRNRKQCPMNEPMPCPTPLIQVPIPGLNRPLPRSDLQTPMSLSACVLLTKRFIPLPWRRPPSGRVSSSCFRLHILFLHGADRNIHMRPAPCLTVPAQMQKNLFTLVPVLPKKPDAAAHACFPFAAAACVSTFLLTDVWP